MDTWIIVEVLCPLYPSFLPILTFPFICLGVTVNPESHWESPCSVSTGEGRQVIMWHLRPVTLFRSLSFPEVPPFLLPKEVSNIQRDTSFRIPQMVFRWPWLLTQSPSIVRCFSYIFSVNIRIYGPYLWTLPFKPFVVVYVMVVYVLYEPPYKLFSTRSRH